MGLNANIHTYMYVYACMYICYIHVCIFSYVFHVHKILFSAKDHSSIASGLSLDNK